MVYLLDVNLLLALFDPGHEHFEFAHQWFEEIDSWSTCTITQMAFIRIASNPAYPGSLKSPQEAHSRLRKFTGRPAHCFWECPINLMNEARLRPEAIRGHQQVTDVCLLLLACLQGGKLATFDKTIPSEAVEGGADALEIIGQ